MRLALYLSDLQQDRVNVQDCLEKIIHGEKTTAAANKLCKVGCNTIRNLDGRHCSSSLEFTNIIQMQIQFDSHILFQNWQMATIAIVVYQASSSFSML